MNNVNNSIKTTTKIKSKTQSNPILSNKVTQGLKSAISTVAKELENTQDGGLQTVAVGIKTASNTVDAIKLTGKMSEDIVNHAIKTGHSIKSSANAIKTEVKKTYVAAVKKGILNGTSPHVEIPSVLFQRLKNAPVDGVKLVGKGLETGKAIGKSTIKTSKTVIKSAYKRAENSLSGSDDAGLQSIGVGAKSTRYTVKTSTYGVKATTKIVKTTTKSTKSAVQVAKNFKRYGLKDTVKYARHKAMQAIKKTTKNVGKAITELFKALTKKALIPVLLVIFGIISIVSISSNIIAAVGSVFSGNYTTADTDTEVDIHQMLIENVNKRKPEMTDEILEIRELALQNEQPIDVVRLYTPKKSIDLIFNEFDENFDEKKQELIRQILEDLMPTEKYVEYMQPMFECLLLAVYDFEPTKADAEKLFKEVWASMTTLKEEKFKENCSVPCATCGARHSNSSCYNSTSGTHSSKTCSCCRRKPIYDDKGNIIGYEFHCNGYRHCNSHDVYSISIQVGDMQKLLDKYFCDEIKRLQNKANRTDEENERLAELQDNWDMCLDYIEEYKQKIEAGEY